MAKLSPDDIVVMFLGLAVLLAAARVMGEVARRFGQPAVLGEIVAGVLLGRTALGKIDPALMGWLFPSSGAAAVVQEAFSALAAALFLLIAGMEVDLSRLWRQGRTALSVSAGGIAVPFALGFAAAWWTPAVLGAAPGEDRLVFALFFATALSISALPVIAKTLMELNLLRSDLGMVVIAAAICNDLLGWIIFAVILGMIGAAAHGATVGGTIVMTLGFVAFMLTAGRWLIHRALPWIQAYASWPGGVLSFAVALGLACAALTERIGVHAIFGAFMAGVALGDSAHLREQTRATLDQFVSFIFAPLFFASIGLRVDFTANFAPVTVLVVLAIACVGKVLGSGLGALATGKPKREAWAIGFAMNARGAMEIILGAIALQHGIIDETMFVALVVMALATSVMSGPVMQRILARKQPRRFPDFLVPKAFVGSVEGADRRGAIRELCRTMADAAGLDPRAVETAVLAREELMPTGIGGGVAVPHARLEGLERSLVGVGLSRAGVDFDAPDGRPARLLILLLTPREDDGAQLELLADISRTVSREEVREQLGKARTFTEFLAALRAVRGPH